VRIPRIFHQIWVGPDPLPDEFAAYGQTWLDHHPGWELKLWTDENFPPRETLIRPESADLLRAPWERADIFRLELLFTQGGVHVDTDFECKRSIEPLIESSDVFVGFRKAGKLNGALMGSVPGHPLVERALHEIEEQRSYGKSMATGDNLKGTSGPEFIDAIFLDQPGVTLIPPGCFYPRTPEELDEAYAVHHKARAWKDEAGLRSMLEKAEQRLAKQQQETRKWRDRYETAAAELERLREGVHGR
jgi:inositol phosphorylceramide mannosyltransferase catalytic subunit